MAGTADQGHGRPRREQAVERAGQARRQVAAVRHLLDGEDAGVPVSSGAAVCPADDRDPAGLLAAADQALRTAGGDRVVAAVPGDGGAVPVPERVTGG